MQYLKRFLSVVLLIALAYINHQIIPMDSMKFTPETVGLCLLNVLFIMIIIGAFIISKTINRSTGIIISEIIIFLVLVLLAFLPQIDALFDSEMTKAFGLSLENLSFTYYIQCVLGFWIVSMWMIFSNKDYRSSKRSTTRITRGNTIRYMR